MELKQFYVHCLQFIIDDLKERGEERASEIEFMGGIFQLKIKGEKRNKTIMYKSGSTMKGYRHIKMPEQAPAQ